MPKAYSIDLRDRAVSRVVAGETVRSVAGVLQVSVASVVKWSQLFRRTGSVAPGPMHGHRPRVLLPHREWLIARTSNDQPFTLGVCGPSLPNAACRWTTARSGLSCTPKGSASKKSVLPSEQERPDIARKRAFWKKHQASVDPRRLVFIGG